MHLLVNESLRHGLNWIAAIQLHDLTLEVLVLEMQQLNFTLQVEDDLLLGVHLNNGLVFDIHGTRRIIQRGDGLVRVHLRRRHACNHECARRTTQAILQQHGQLGVTEWNIFLV